MINIPYLSHQADKLVLILPGFSKPFEIDFATMLKKTKQKGGKREGLIRAIKPAPNLHIIDATAGWARDSLLLASFGAQVTMIERNPLLYQLLENALHRFMKNEAAYPLLLSLIHADAKDYLNFLGVKEYPDIIYMDPMHPARQKTALVKKNMQALQHLLGPDLDAHNLLTIALQRVKQRVVIKWPQKLPPLQAPHASILGKTTRFDIFVP